MCVCVKEGIFLKFWNNISYTYLLFICKILKIWLKTVLIENENMQEIFYNFLKKKNHSITAYAYTKLNTNVTNNVF